MEKDQENTESVKPVKIPIEDVLDLHTFLPKEIPGLLEEYLNACQQARIYSVRIVHGKGQGFLKNRVRSLLEKLSMVASYSDAPASAGGWGATIVELKRESELQLPELSGFIDHVNEGARAMGVHLDRSQSALFALHAKELLEWNRVANLTAITKPAELAEKQFLDTLSLPPFVPWGSRVLDIGSGGGFPGIPLKVIRPDLHLTLIDASRKKVHFLKHIIRTMGLKDIEARHIRAEGLAVGVQAEVNPYDVIISKAVCKLNNFLDRAFPLLHQSGSIVAMKGASVDDELESAKSRIKGHALRLEKKAYRLPLLGINRTLIVLRRK